MGDTVARPDAWCQRRARRSELSSAVGGGAGCRVAALGVDGGDATASPVFLGALSCLRCTLLPAPLRWTVRILAIRQHSRIRMNEFIHSSASGTRYRTVQM